MANVNTYLLHYPLHYATMPLLADGLANKEGNNAMSNKPDKHILKPLSSWELLAIEAALIAAVKSGAIEKLSGEALIRKVAAA